MGAGRDVNLTYRYRVKSLNGLLNRQSRTVNFVWNFCNESQKSAIRLGKRWPSGFDLEKLTSGTCVDLGLHAGTVSAICKQYVKSRKQHKSPWLRWRGRRSLGWIPLKGRELKAVGDSFRYHSRTFRVFNSRPIPEGAKICDGSSFSQDARGRWYLNLVLEIPEPPKRDGEAIGIDPGLTHVATLSNGEKIENPRHFRAIEDRLGMAQRANKKRLAATLHARAKNSRRDFLHKQSVRIARRFAHIAIGKPGPGLARTRMAKSVLDAGWATFRHMLAYKAIKHGATFAEVDEKYSTQVCSHCGALPSGRPEGIADLGIRTWTCGECGTFHDRDVNAARNILFGSGHRSPVEGIAGSSAGVPKAIREAFSNDSLERHLRSKAAELRGSGK